jgi:biopolymer transport protein ExbB
MTIISSPPISASSIARRLLPGLALLATLLALPMSARAWWNEDWTERTRYTLDTTAQGQPITEAVSGAPLVIRLHSGNFDFLGAKEDGSDLRVLAADDKTVLPHRLERFDATNELAVLWVTLPTLLPGSDKNLVYVYAGNAKAPVLPAVAGVGDPALKLQVRFDGAGAATGLDSVAGLKASAAVTPEPNALLAGGARLDGKPLVWPSSDGLKISATMPATLSLWLRADDVARGTLLDWGPLQLVLKGGKLEVRVDGTALAGGQVAVATWTHVALVLEGQRARLHVNGLEVASAAAPTPDLAGPLQVGADLHGAIDELQIAASARSAAWLTLVAASQGSEGKLVKATRESAAEAGAGAGAGEHGYMGILVKNLTSDAWAVIIILAFMFVLAVWVTVSKLRFIGQSAGDNRRFLGRFRQATTELMQLDQGAKHPHSSLFRLYNAGLRELKKRHIGEPGSAPLSAASLNAVKASVDADLVRESHRLNAQMVWLTIAISGGPFLGLLGTVVGVMITFAAIAAAGDVNVNAIAPGIAAALLATVAGLAVAIPALFAYNYLASRIKTS